MNLRKMTLMAFILPFTSLSIIRADGDSVGHKMGYKEIGDMYLSSYGVIEIEKPKEQNALAAKEKKIDLTIPNFTQPQRLKLLFELQQRNDVIKPSANAYIDEALNTALKDVDTYFGTGKNKQSTLINSLDNTTTASGSIALAYHLAHPLSNISQLNQRQALVKELIANPELAGEIELLLKQIKNAESGFLSFWKPEDPTTSDFFKTLFWSKWLDPLNRYTAGGELAVRTRNFGSFLEMGGSTLLALAATKYVFEQYIPNPRPFWQVMIGMIPTPANVKEGVAMVKRIYNWQPQDPEEIRMRQIILYGGAAYFALLIGLQGYQTKVAVNKAREIRDAINYLQTRLTDVATVVRTCTQVRLLAQNNKALNEGLLAVSALNDLLEGQNCTTEFARLVDMLQTNTFNGTSSFFSVSGRVLAAYRLMTEEKEYFAPALAALGELDACLSMAKLVKKMDKERVKYSFVNFVDTPQPYVKLVDFWNPLIDPQTVVTNSFSLGHNTGASKVILTGSNTGGKSTILKALLTSFLLSRSFGISPSTECTMSPFAFVGSSLHLNDDTAGDESKFKAEVLRAKMLSETIKSLGKDQFGFVVIDELFTGTGAEKAARAAQDFAQKLAENDNSLYILATHFPQLTQLEKTKPGVIKNYKVEAYKDANGKIVRPFKLEVGISTQNIAQDILREEMKDFGF